MKSHIYDILTGSLNNYPQKIHKLKPMLHNQINILEASTDTADIIFIQRCKDIIYMIDMIPEQSRDSSNKWPYPDAMTELTVYERTLFYSLEMLYENL